MPRPSICAPKIGKWTIPPKWGVAYPRSGACTVPCYISSYLNIEVRGRQ